MEKLYIVVTIGGFLTSKKESELLESDNVLSEAKDERDAEKLIHGSYTD